MILEKRQGLIHQQPSPHRQSNKLGKEGRTERPQSFPFPSILEGDPLGSVSLRGPKQQKTEIRKTRRRLKRQRGPFPARCFPEPAYLWGPRSFDKRRDTSLFVFIGFICQLQNRNLQSGFVLHVFPMQTGFKVQVFPAKNFLKMAIPFRSHRGRCYGGDNGLIS